MFFSILKSHKEPDTLANLSLECMCKNLTDVFDSNEHGWHVATDMVLPREICETLIEIYQRIGKSVDDKFLHLFNNTKQTILKKVTIWNSSITDLGLKMILQYNLHELDLAYCKELTPKALYLINKYSSNLKSLSIGPEVNIISNFSSTRIGEDNIDDAIKTAFFYRDIGHRTIFNTPNLTRLILKDIQQLLEPSFYETLLASLPNLIHLDLSSCKDLRDLSYIPKSSNLSSLILFNCAHLQKAIPYICELKKLRHLDISQVDDKQGTFSFENQTLSKIITSLPNLVSLDISGTNLAGKGHVEKDLFDEKEKYHSDIPGLASRTNNPLKFLGLYGTHHRASKRHHIPSIKISGDATEDQILTAGAVYMNRPQILQRIFNDLFHVLRMDACVNIEKILKIILEGLCTHAQEKNIQISGSAALFYIVRNKNSSLLTEPVKNMVIKVLVNSMTSHMDDETMLRNGCLTLCQFRLPQDILFDYEKVAELMLKIIMKEDQEGFAQRIGIFLMNTLACQVNDAQKEILGNLGLIENMLLLISTRVSLGIYDDVLEVAWSTMWNVTDETPINCKRFLDGNGMDYFVRCLEQFREMNELMRNMMGLLGNVAEVKELRPRLMPYIDIFFDLVDSFQDGIEVSYNAAGVISHIASDGPEAWFGMKMKRETVLSTMVWAIERWNIKSERNINYRSFEPILKLTRVQHTPQCQHWAIWALANLTQVYPEKYCPILEAEGGLNDIQALLEDTKPYMRIKQLAKMVMSNYQQFKEEKQRNQNQSEAMNVVQE